MLALVFAIALLSLVGCAGGGAGVPPARSTVASCLGVALMVGASGCKQQTPPPSNVARTAFCINVARAWTFDPSVDVGFLPARNAAPDPAELRAAKFECVRVDFHHGTASDWIARVRGIGMPVIVITDQPTAADIADPTAYTSILTTGMRRFPGQSWELIAEADQGDQGYKLSPAQYVTFLKTVIPQLRAADPTATLISGGVVGKGGNRPTWLSDISELWPLVDEIGLHCYPPPWLPNPIDTLPAILAATKAQTGKPGIVTEWGLAQQYAPLKPGDPLPNPLTQAQAAADIVQMIHTVDGITPRFVVYEWDNRDDQWAATEGFGIVGTPELAAFTAAR